MNSCETTNSHARLGAGSFFSWRRLAVLACTVYWGLLLTGTHLPRLPQPIVLSSGLDKICHFIGYAGLAFLLSAVWRAWISRGRAIPLRGYLIVVCLAAFYGAFDELTQPLVGRTCELGDWLADVSGAVFGCALFSLVYHIVWRPAKFTENRTLTVLAD
jgi:VanZ family protein